MIVDATAPTVNGLENNKTYCGDVKFTATDKISLRLPESLVSKDRFILRKYKIIRLHDGKVDSLDAENDSNINYYC